MHRARLTEPVRCVERSLDILETLATERELALADLARRVQLPPSSVHRLLATLMLRGYVDQHPETGSYRLCRRPAPVAGVATGAVTGTPWLRPAVRPYLERARKVTSATANLAVLERDDTVYLDQVRARPAVSMFVATGKRLPAHASAAGKALLCERWRRTLQLPDMLEPYTRYTGSTVTTAANLGRELAEIRARGFAIDDEEHQAGISCVAAPIFDDAAEPVAALSISGPSRMIRETGFEELGEFVVTLTSELSAELRRGAADEAAYRSSVDR